jgi:hypothetical protein
LVFDWRVEGSIGRRRGYGTGAYAGVGSCGAVRVEGKYMEENNYRV